MEAFSAQLKARLEMTEQALERSERLAVANRYAGAIMHDVNNPLEAITNLVYLPKSEKDDPAQVLECMAVIEEQLKILGRVAKQALAFHWEHSDASEASGTGLALWLSSRIITKHQGKLRFRTSRRDGKNGTTFRIQLPNALGAASAVE